MWLLQIIDDLNDFRIIEIHHSYYIIPNESMQNYTPYPLRSPYSASSQPNLLTSNKQNS